MIRPVPEDMLVRAVRLALGLIGAALVGLVWMAYLEWKDGRAERRVMAQLRADNPTLKDRTPLGRARMGALGALKLIRREHESK